ncbi:MAG: helix-turn-helix transcriptional regulator [Ktedonobacteraceae bacterium]|nr:helix-turn-helix transcriptional regulator [Ktedonobacteraceae bacterium]
MTLKELREAKNLTQLEVAYELKTTPGTISNWERGVQEPRLNQVQSLAKLYGVSTDEIIRAVQNSKQS